MFTDSSDVLHLQHFLKKKLEFTLNFGYLHFQTRSSTSFRQHVGCRFLCYPSLAKLYYGLIELDRDSKVVQGVKREKISKII